MVEMKETTVIKTFDEMTDIVAITEATGTDASSTTSIAKIGDYLMD